ncbi:MAG: hypothetical protein ACRCU0_05260 [Candidatus Rhabdochlamydia sp.]
MDVQKPTESHAEININKICNDYSTNTQAKLQAVLWMLFNSLTDAFVVINKAKSESGLAAIKAGFAAANETATAGLLQLGSGAAVAGTGIVQGMAGYKKVAELSEIKEWRDTRIMETQENTMTLEEHLSVKSESLPMENTPIENPDLTVQVEALDEPVSPELSEIEEEIFYDAEETMSCKQTKSEQQTEEEGMVKKADALGKMTRREADKDITQINKEYEANRDIINTKKEKFEALAPIGQGIYYVALGLGDVEKAKAQKENIQQQVEQDNQNQQGNTADDIKRKADKLTEFDAFRTNSSSLRG